MTAKVLSYRLPVLLMTVGLAFLTAACGTPAEPTPVPEVVTIPTERASPQSTPSTRTAPTLPPEWTKTFTPTFTATLLPSATPTVTVVPPETEICDTFTFELELLGDTPVPSDTGINFGAGVDPRDAVITVFIGPEGSDDVPDTSVIPGGSLYLTNFGKGFAPGVYRWSASVSTSHFTSICPKSGMVTIVEPRATATPGVTERPSLGEELLGVIVRRLRDDILIPLQTQTAQPE